MKMGKGKISACFLLVAFADSEIWEQQAADSVTQPYRAGIQLRGSRGAFLRQAIALIVYVASQKTAGKTVNSLILITL